MINHLGTIKIETDRLLLKLDSISEEDILWKYMYSDKEAVKECKWKDFGDKDNFIFMHQKSLSNVKNSDYWWTIWLKEESIPIGGITVHHQDDINESCEIGYSINPKYQNNGYATEALLSVISFLRKEVGYSNIICNCQLSNISSQRVMEKAHLDYKGIIKDQNGNDVFSYSTRR